MSAHKWTTEPPTESGIYWACDLGSASSVKNLSSVRVTVFPLSGCVSVHEAIAGELPVGYFTHWMRIDTPDLPEFKGGANEMSEPFLKVAQQHELDRVKRQCLEAGVRCYYGDVGTLRAELEKADTATGVMRAFSRWHLNAKPKGSMR